MIFPQILTFFDNLDFIHSSWFLTIFDFLSQFVTCFTNYTFLTVFLYSQFFASWQIQLSFYNCWPFLTNLDLCDNLMFLTNFVIFFSIFDLFFNFSFFITLTFFTIFSGFFGQFSTFFTIFSLCTLCSLKESKTYESGGFWTPTCFLLAEIVGFC